jgi:hypothetical protein
VDYVQFRKANPEFAGLSDTEISGDINEYFRAGLQPQTEDWNGYELTFYVNPGATDIRSIKPYAAYDLKYNEWTVTPDPTAHAPYNSSWETQSKADADMANQVSTRFSAAMQEIQTSHNDPLRRNAETRLQNAVQQGSALYEEIHGNRRLAFSTAGEGYSDFNNYRWQAAKRTGVIQVLRQVRDYAETLRKDNEVSIYGVDLPSTDTLIRRAALQGKR